MSDVARQWMDLVTERSGGAIKFDDSYGGALGAGPELAEKLEAGSVQVLGPTASSYASGKFPHASIQFTFPFGPTDTRVVLETDRQMMKDFPQYMADYSKYNHKLMITITSPAYSILSKNRINKLSDLNGVKFGIWGSYFGRWFAPAGGVPVASPSAERYEMLRTGVIDANVLPSIEHYQNSIREQAKYLTAQGLTAHSVWNVFMAEDVFEGMSPEGQKIMMDSAREIEEAAITTILPHWENDIVFPAWKEAGVEWVDFDADEWAKWASLVDDIPAEYAEEMVEKGYPGWEMVKRSQEISASWGHEWPRLWGIQK
jgi:TRAP-type C4-dicarboxylate transport system substrate-binding protein